MPPTPPERLVKAAERSAKATERAAAAMKRSARNPTPARHRHPVTAGENLEAIAGQLCQATGLDGADELAARFKQVWRDFHAEASAD